MIHSRQKNPDEIFEFCERFSEFETKVPLVVVPTSYNTVTEEEFTKRGVSVVIYANQLMRASYKAMSSVAKTILEHSRSAEVDSQIANIKEALAIIPENES